MHPPRVAVIGSSFPNRLHAFLERQDKNHENPLAENLFVDKSNADVLWCTSEGLTLDRLHRDLWPVLESFGRIDGAILQIGSIDMCTISVNDFVQRLLRETLPALFTLGCCHVILTQSFYRRPGFQTQTLDLPRFNTKIAALNAALQALVCPHGMSLVYWEHSNVLNCGSLTKAWSPDGIHFNDKGHSAFSRSMCGALKHVLKSIHSTPWPILAHTDKGGSGQPQIECPRPKRRRGGKKQKKRQHRL